MTNKAAIAVACVFVALFILTQLPQKAKPESVESEYPQYECIYPQEPEPAEPNATTDVTDVKNDTPITYEVTAYTANCESTGKGPDHPLYGVTASGEAAIEGVTIAGPPELAFGTEVYIPHFDRTFIVQDRGGDIRGRRLDIYMDSVDNAVAFGRRNLDVVVVK